MQAKFKKDQLDKVREEQNVDAATGEVLRHRPRPGQLKNCGKMSKHVPIAAFCQWLRPTQVA